MSIVFPGDNDTLSKHVLEITNINETCIQVNKTSPNGHEVFLYIAPATEKGVEIRITTENCSTPLPKLHLSLCDDNDIDNSTKTLVTFAFKELNASDILDDDSINPTPETILYTGPTVYETMHHLDKESEEEQNITTVASVLDIEATGPTVYETIHNLDHNIDSEQDIIITTPPLEAELYTGPTVYETIHNLDHNIDSEQDIIITTPPLKAESFTGPTIFETMHHLDEDNTVTNAPRLNVEKETEKRRYIRRR